jgi:predicted RecB family nuclease
MHRRDGKLIVAATDLVGFLQCGHLTRLDRAAVAGLIRKPDRSDDPEVELLQRRGHAHEQRYVQHLSDKRLQIADLSAEREGLSYDALAARTIEEMRNGADVIYQATVFDGRWVGFPDFLLRVDTPAQQQRAGDGLGHDFHYEIADTKLSHAVKASALIQIASYVEQIEHIQGVRPEAVYVVTGGATIAEHPFRTAEMMAYYRHAKQRFEQAIDEAVVGAPMHPIPRETSYPDPVEHCSVCKYFPDYCRVQWRDDDALPRVAGISRDQRKVLTAHDVTTMRGLSELTQPFHLDLKRSQNDSMWRAREQARLQVATGGNKVPEFDLLQPERDTDEKLVPDRGLSALPPPSEHDLFFDIEGDPFAFWEGLEYLFGIWDGADYRDYWALTRDEEKQQFERVIDLFHGHWLQHREMHIYHYGSYEPSRLKRLAGLHATRQDELDDLLRGRVFVDLFRVVQQGVRVGSEKYSIKNMEPLYEFERVINLRDANSSIVEFEKLLEVGDPSGELKTLIQGYNKDDTVSTQKLRDWLEARRAEVKLEPGEELPRPAPGQLVPPTEDLTERIRQVQEMTARLTAGIDPDPERQSPVDQATWLVAHLLDWHRREDKSTYWRFFDLMSKSDEELVEEGEPIGGLQLIDQWELPKPSKSNVYRYSFPTQDFKIDFGDSLNDPQLYAAGEKKTATGSVYAIDDTALTLDIKRGRDWAGPHPTSVVGLDVIDAKAQRLALMRLADWVVTNGIESQSTEWRAARDLLLRLAPRLLGADGDDRLVVDGLSGSEAAVQLARRLDGTTLAIQGPPGSGKTHRRRNDLGARRG